MLDFGPFCYLDLQKTGSTFVGRFLRSHINLDLIAYKRHKPFPYNPERDSNKVMFITVREPVQTYQSLYRYGSSDRGFAKRLKRLRPDLTDLFDGQESSFLEWLECMLDPEFADALPDGYNKTKAGNFGFLTHRFLKLAIEKPARHLKQWRSVDDVRKGYAKHRLPLIILKNETLNEDLSQLAQNQLRPYIKDLGAALESLSIKTKRVNATDASQVFNIPPALEAKIHDREWLLYEQFYNQH